MGSLRAEVSFWVIPKDQATANGSRRDQDMNVVKFYAMKMAVDDLASRTTAAIEMANTNQ